MAGRLISSADITTANGSLSLTSRLGKIGLTDSVMFDT